VSAPTDGELLRTSFVPEARDLLEEAGQALLALEHDPMDRPALDRLFRAVHTIKGTAGIFDLPPLVHLVHAAEDLLGRIRDGTLALTGAITDDLLAALDHVGRWVERLDARGTLPVESAGIAREHAARCRAWMEQGAVPPAPAAGGEPAANGARIDDEALRLLADLPAGTSGPLRLVSYEPRPDCFFNGEDPLFLLRQLPDLVGLRIVPKAPWPEAAAFDPYACNLRFLAVTSAPRAAVEHLFRYVLPETAIHEVEAAGPAARERVLKVEQHKVDLIMTLVGELAVAKNALPFLSRRAEAQYGSRELAREIKDQYAVIDRIAQEMQAAVMGIRMLPVSEMFKRFPRLVRDIARKLGKRVELELSGESTEADKNVIEALANPILHLVRNCLDHGLELPEERLAAGKPDVGRVRLHAYREGDRVVIEVGDDGRGIDPAKVRAKALEKGLIEPERAAQLSDQEAVQLVFLPGLSTAAQVSDLSGRGVGTDVVRSTVERLGGTVELESQPGRGTTIRLDLPLSMAVTRVMTVEAGGQLFGVPMELVVEIVRVPKDRLRRIKRAETFTLRDAVIPLVRLRALLAMAPLPRAEEAVLVVRIAGMPLGLVIDEFRTGMDVILKPMGGILGGMPGYAGTAVLGDGKVLLVLNLKELL
jgi:two-component system chemotaxis sensor kinase CheA